MSFSSSYSLLIPAPATGCFHGHYHSLRLKCGSLALNWSKSCQHAGSFLSAPRMRKAKSRRRRLFHCKSQLAELAPATSATYGLLLLGGGLFAYTKSGSKGSLFGGLTGAALMASIVFRAKHMLDMVSLLSISTALLKILASLSLQSTSLTREVAAYFLMQVPDTRAVGDAVGFGSAFLFFSVFAIRLAATRKLTPAGPLLALSICALAVFISAYLQDKV